MLSNDAKLLAVYDDLLAKIEEVKAAAERIEGAPGEKGKDGKDGRDAPDYHRELFAAIGALHSDLVKQMISLEREITVTPEINIKNDGYLFDVERDNKGFINRVRATPLDTTGGTL